MDHDFKSVLSPNLPEKILVDNGYIDQSRLIEDETRLSYSSGTNPTGGYALQGQNISTLENKENDIQASIFGAEPSAEPIQEQGFQTGIIDDDQNPLANIYSEEFATFLDEAWAGIPECDLPTMEGIDFEMEDSASSASGLFTLADYDICTGRLNNEVLAVTTNSSPPSSSDSNSLSEDDGCQLMDPQNPLLVRSLVDDTELSFTTEPSHWTSSYGMQYGVPPGTNSATTSEEISTSSYFNEGEAQQFTPMSQEQGNSDCQHPAGNNFPSNERLLVEKLLTASDIGNDAAGVLLPKKDVELNFPRFEKQLELTLHDPEEIGKIWKMRLTINDGAIYRLKQSIQYTRHYSLQAGDLLGIFLDVQRGRYVVRFEKRNSIHMPTSVVDSASNDEPMSWKPVIRKKLTKTDVTLGLKGYGQIFMGKKDVQKNFPPLSEKEGYLINFVDWRANCMWEMRLKFKSENSAGRLYLLKNIRDFLKTHELGQGDVVEFWKSDSTPARYALTAKKTL
ncbi:unnamed protein product [Calypogeia fissa]